MAEIFQENGPFRLRFCNRFSKLKANFAKKTYRTMLMMLSILGIDWHAWLTVILIITMFAILLKTNLPTDIVFLGGMTILLISGTLTQQQTLASFSSESVFTVGVLYIVVAGLVYSGAVQWAVDHLLGTPKGYRKAIVKLMVPVAALSAFLSNSTVVAMFINIVKVWARKLNIAPGKLYIPLSYAAGMGGICTLIGTPPNLIISSYYTGQSGISLPIFTTLLPGLFCLVVGIAATVILSKLLPDRRADTEQTIDIDRSVIYELKVSSHNRLVGQSFKDCGLNQYVSFNTDNSDKPRIMSIVRFDRDIVSNVNEDEVLMGGDHIAISGNANDIMNICNKFGLQNSVYGMDEIPESGTRTLVATFIMIGIIVLSYLSIFSILECCFIAAMLMIICRCCTIKQARQSISWDILMVFAGSICLGSAIEQTGLAEMTAKGILSICGSNPIVILTAICLAGTFITEFVSNTAAGAIFAPIAYNTALQLGVNPLTFCVALMISVSSSFATPIGSPTHLMVYGPGGYRFNDFMRIGIPMNFIILAANIFITTLVFPL